MVLCLASVSCGSSRTATRLYAVPELAVWPGTRPQGSLTLVRRLKVA